MTPVNNNGETNVTVKICAAWTANAALSLFQAFRFFPSRKQAMVFDSFERHRALADHLIDPRNDLSDLLFRVDDFDQDREVAAKLEDLCDVDLMKRSTEAFDAAENRRASDAFVPQHLDDGGV